MDEHLLVLSISTKEPLERPLIYVAHEDIILFPILNNMVNAIIA